MHDIAIIGGGLAGLINSILLGKAGFRVVLFEKHQYPFHRVCGEYISNEVVPFLKQHEIYPEELNPAQIDQLLISSINGKCFQSPLDLGGFGISRYQLDHWLAQKAVGIGVELEENTTVETIHYDGSSYQISTNRNENYSAKVVISSHGKRSKLDQNLDRDFLKKRSPFVGVKYHIKTDLPADQIALHNFEGGYCGVSMVEDGVYNMCYLTDRKGIREHGNIPDFEQEVLYKNPHLKSLFMQSDFLFDKPKVINEITFDKHEPVCNDILMCGDAAGMITPLCGNGMAMAIHSAKLLSDLIIDHHQEGTFPLDLIQQQYAARWKRQFAQRLWAGRKIQDYLFGNNWASELAVFTGKHLKPIANSLIRQTHGSPF